MITVWYETNTSLPAISSFHVGACPYDMETTRFITMAQADGHELTKIYEVYPHLLEKFKNQRHKDRLARVIKFYGADAQYAAAAFLEYSKD